MKQRSYIVFGSTGEGEDTSTWPVVTYSNSIAADVHVELANLWLKENGCHLNSLGRGIDVDYHAKSTLVNPFDPHFHTDYTGAEYFVESVPARISSVRPIRSDEA